jgi:hypothetical protein
MTDKIRAESKKTAVTWGNLLKPGQAKAAIEVARKVAWCLRDREHVEAAVVASERQTKFPKSMHWQPATVAQGFAGLALMHGAMDACFPGEGWDQEAHRALRLAVWDANSPINYLPGLFSGLSGLAFVAQYVSRGAQRYAALLRALDDAIVPRTVESARLMHKKPTADGSVSNFDLISGLAGIAAYLLCRIGETEVKAALHIVLDGLVALTYEDDEGLPHWRTPVHLIADEAFRSHYPNGNLNCGMAHGIPCVLAVLALAELSGISVDGAREAIERVARWLSENRCDDAAGVNWPNAVPLTWSRSNDGVLRLQPAESASAPFGPSRCAWCYGPPGIARALWLAGKSLNEECFCDLAVAAMTAVHRRPIPQRQIDSPTFCHGVAGLLQITLRFAHDTGSPEFAELACELVEQLLGMYNPDTELGYQSLEPSGRRIDQPGFLDGAAGIPGVLLAAAAEVEPSWDRLFLLS